MTLLDSLRLKIIRVPIYDFLEELRVYKMAQIIFEYSSTLVYTETTRKFLFWSNLQEGKI